jgi:phage terminase small subunit
VLAAHAAQELLAVVHTFVIMPKGMGKHIPVPTKDTPPWAAELTLKQRRFVEEFIVDLNGRAAGVRGGLGKSPKSAGEIASKLRKIPGVAAAISALMAQRNGVTGAAVVGELGAIAFSRISNYLRIQDGRLTLAVASLDELPDEAVAAIAKLKERVNDDGSISIEVELHDKLGALDRLGKSICLFKEAGVNHRHKHEHEFVDPMARIKDRLNALRKAQQSGPTVEIHSPSRRIAPPQPERQEPIIDIE